MSKRSLVIVFALLIAGGATGLVSYQAFFQEEVIAWPAFTMEYTTSSHSARVGDTSVPVTTDYRLTYTAHDNWREDITASPPVTTRLGTFSRTGSYQQVMGNQLTNYEAGFDHTTTETIPEGSRQLPHSNFNPRGLESLEDDQHFQQAAVPTETNVRVCFDDVCQDNAPGWKFTLGDQVYVYTDDERGIPLTFSGMTVTELRVTGARQAFER